MSSESASTPQDAVEYSRTLLNAFHRHYAERSDEWTDDVAMRSFPLVVQGEVKLGGTEEVCDLGCGAGVDCEFYSSIARRVVGVDLYRHERWDEVMRHRHNVTFHCCDAVDFRPASSFALVVDNGSFHHQHPSRYVAYLTHVRQLMQEGGCFALSTFKNASKSEFTDQYGRIHKYFRDRELRDLLSSAKLQIYREIECYRTKQRDYYRFSFIRQQ